MKIQVVVVAAGAGTRMGGGPPKIVAPLGQEGKPVLWHALSAFERHEAVDGLVVVLPENMTRDLGAFDCAAFRKLKAVVPGGVHRQASVYAGLQAVDADTDGVLIHDGARPLVSRAVIDCVLVHLRRGECAISGVPAKDTVKIADETGAVRDTPPRERVWLAHTPQGFPYTTLRRAHEKALAEGLHKSEATDDATLVERLGVPVYLAKGCYKNIKITTPEDLIIAGQLLPNHP